MEEDMPLEWDGSKVPEWTHADQGALLRLEQSRLRILKGIKRLEVKGRRNWNDNDAVAHAELTSTLRDVESQLTDVKRRKKEAKGK